jgi:hypothetical protein
MVVTPLVRTREQSRHSPNGERGFDCPVPPGAGSPPAVLDPVPLLRVPWNPDPASLAESGKREVMGMDHFLVPFPRIRLTMGSIALSVPIDHG